MRKNLLIQHFLVGLMLCNVFIVSCSNNTERSSCHPKQDADSPARPKRGLVLLVPSNSNEASPESHETASEQSSPEPGPATQQPADKGKRDAPATPGIFMRHNDMLDARRYVTRVPASDEDDEENASKPYVRFKSVSGRKEIIKRLLEARQSRRRAEESPIAIVIGRRINRPRGTRGKKYTCYCKEARPAAKRCAKGQLASQVSWRTDGEAADDEYEDEDVSAEVTDEPRTEQGDEGRLSRLAAAEPTKFSIPFANNVNFNQRVVLARRSDDKKKYRIQPVYQNIPLEVFRNSPSNSRYNPHVVSQNADMYTGIKQLQRDEVEATESNAEIISNHMDECISIYGADICADMAAADLSDEDLVDLSEDDSEILMNDNQESRGTESPLIPLNDESNTRTILQESVAQSLPDYSAPKNVASAKHDKRAEPQRRIYQLPLVKHQSAQATATLTARAGVPKLHDSSAFESNMYSLSSTTPAHHDYEKMPRARLHGRGDPASIGFVQNPRYEAFVSHNLQKHDVGQPTGLLSKKSEADDKTNANNIIDIIDAERKGNVQHGNVKQSKNTLPLNVNENMNTDQVVSESKKVDDAIEKTINGQTKVTANNPKSSKIEKEAKKNHYPSTTISNISEGTETAVQSVDERPSAAYDNNSSETGAKLGNQVNNPQDRESAPRRNSKEAVLQNAIKTVINNFVPGRAQDLLANFGSGNLPALVAGTDDLLPEILDTPLLKNLLLIPEVEDMLIDKSSRFLIQIIDSPNHQLSYKSIRKSLRDVVEQIPHPHPTVAPSTVPDDQPNGQWVTERVTLLDASDLLTTAKPPREVFDRIESIISRSDLGEQAAAQPIVQNLIVKTVKHCLDKERGAIDELTIRQAFNMLVRPKAPVTRRAPGESEPSTSPTKQSEQLDAEEERRKILDGKEPRPSYGSDRHSGRKGFPGSKNDSIEDAPIRYYSPNNKILDYKKNHQSTEDAIPPTLPGSTNDCDDRTSECYKKKLPMPEITLPYVTAEAQTTQRMYQPNFELTTQQSSSNKINLLVNPRKPKAHSAATSDGAAEPTQANEADSTTKPIYLGKLLPVNYDKKADNYDNLADLQDSRLMYVGDGVRLPLALRKMQDGSLALTLSDEMCKQFEDKRCPCCLPSDNGLVVRERRSGEIIPELSFADDEVVLANGKSKEAAFKRMRRESGEYDEWAAVGGKGKRKMVQASLGRSSGSGNRSRGKSNYEKNRESTSIKTLFDYEDDKSLISMFKHIRNQHNEASVRPPYRYQRYVYEDEDVKERTSALKNMIYWMRNLFVNNSRK